VRVGVAVSIADSPSDSSVLPAAGAILKIVGRDSEVPTDVCGFGVIDAGAIGQAELHVSAEPALTCTIPLHPAGARALNFSVTVYRQREFKCKTK